MSQLLSRRKCQSANRLLSGFAAALILSTIASGCTEPETSVEVVTPSKIVQPTPKELFMDHCASCHGVDGSGNGPLAAEMRVAPENLRLLKQTNNGNFPSVKVQRSVDGRAMPRSHGLPDMPVWGRHWLRQGLNEADVKARAIMITGYIASIQD